MFERNRIKFIFFSILPFSLSSYLFKDLLKNKNEYFEEASFNINFFS
jgi:hypothetical protein